jgi:hypothetical protein
MSYKKKQWKEWFFHWEEHTYVFEYETDKDTAVTSYKGIK